MITDPMGLVAALLAIEGGILFFADDRRTRFLFTYLPGMFWIYFLPMLATTFGLLPEKSPVYDSIRGYCLPGCLALLLISVDFRAILRLGPVALTVMLAGSLGIMVGGPVALAIFKPLLPEGVWSGFGALSASWIGGSANMLAVKEMIGTPNAIFSPMVVVDTLVPYAWMGLLIALSSRQAAFDTWNRSRDGLVADLQRQAMRSRVASMPMDLKHVTLMFALAAGVTFAALLAGRRLAEFSGVINTYAWTIILASAAGIALSFTPARRLEKYGASKVGYAMLYLVLASIGAGTSFSHLASAPILIVAGVVWVLIHGLFVLAAGRLLRAPMSLLAAASQANVGGVASAPVVAGIYQPGMASVGLLLAILGNIIGTYLGWVCAMMCKWVGG